METVRNEHGGIQQQKPSAQYTCPINLLQVCTTIPNTFIFNIFHYSYPCNGLHYPSNSSFFFPLLPHCNRHCSASSFLTQSPSTSALLTSLSHNGVSNSNLHGITMSATFRYTLLLIHFGLFTLSAFAEEWDHQAHSKPGGPYYHVDWDGDGSEQVTLDATESHSHYFNHGPPPESGRIVEYHWESSASGKTIIKTGSPFVQGTFYLGITILKLTVTDQTGDEATGWTYISVRKPRADENKPPTIQSISPEAGPPSGGISVTIKGTNFYNHPKVTFSGYEVEFRVVSDTEIVAVSPVVTSEGKMAVSVQTGFGTAKPATYSVTNKIKAPIAFTYTELQERTKGGALKPFGLSLVTCIKIGPDGRYYAGSRDGFIYKFALSRGLVVEQWCKGPLVGKSRSVTGIAFHPHEWSTARAYVSTGALYWKKSGAGGWANGDVEVWTSVPSAECMEYSHTVVSGLPVSNHDHGVNALEFTNHGDLYIAVGGTTNAGVHFDGDSVGGIPESPFSGAVLVAQMSKGVKFDGKVTYNQYTDPGTANVVSGDVKVYSAGMRNVFGMTRHSNGNLYAMDNGPNPGYGKTASSCGEAGPQLGFKDKLLLLKHGAYYGHPNWNRGRTDPRQCKFVQGDTKGLSENVFVPPLGLLDSSTNAIVEYTANTFEGQMRGDLMLGKLSWGKDGELSRVKLSKNGEYLLEGPAPFLKESGLSMVMGPFGELIMPKYVGKRIVGYVPKDSTHEALRVIAVTPRRGPKGGVNPVLITGNGFWEGVKIFFGNKECLTYKARTAESVWCQVPPGSGKVPVVAKRDGLVSKSYGGDDYEYMAY